MTSPISYLRRLYRQVLNPLVDQRPANILIRQTAKREWRLIATSLLSSLVQAASEGFTLGVMFLAVEVLSKPARSPAGLGNKLFGVKPLYDAFPQLVDLLNNISVIRAFTILLTVAVVLKVIQGVAMLIGSIATGYFSNRVSRKVTSDLHSQILNYTFSCASRYRVGDLQYMIGAGPSSITTAINNYSGFITTLLLLLTYLWVLIRLSPWLLFAAFLLGATSTLIQNYLLPRLGARARKSTALGQDLMSRMTENIQGLRLLHTSGFLEEAATEVDKYTHLYEHNERGKIRLLSINGPLILVLPILMIGIIAWLSVVFFEDKSSGILPSLVTFVVALQRLNGAIGSISSVFMNLKNNSANLNLLNTFLSTTDKEFRREGGLPFTGFSHSLTLADVGLSYGSELSRALDGVSMEIPKGSTVALVGRSGAGKSSIADLLAGLYEPTEGKLLIDGQDIRQFNLASWQKRIGVVSQDTFLFNATIAANIAFGTPTASLADVQRAAGLAQASGFIESLPDGYETLVGERGYRLSGGQRQRLSLARALLRQPDLLILDEATSALDTESERLVQEAIDQFDKTYTILVIAHRLSTIVNADLIYVLDQGHVIEQGNHSQLLEQGGRYAKLWQQQVKVRQKATAPQAT